MDEPTRPKQAEERTKLPKSNPKLEPKPGRTQLRIKKQVYRPQQPRPKAEHHQARPIKSSAKPDTGGHNEKTVRHGVQASKLPKPSGGDSLRACSLPSQPSGPASGVPNPETVGQSEPVDPVSITTPVLTMTQTRTTQNKQVQITVCSWNIRRGLLIREEELKALIKTKGIDVFFLVETDSNTVNDESDYQIEGFKTLVQKKRKNPIAQELSAYYEIL